MQVTETLSDGLKRAYTIVLPKADIEERRSARLADLSKTLRLPGFRPGKVPPLVVRQRFGSAVAAEILEQSVDDAVRQVMNERGLRPAARPRVDVVSEDVAARAAIDVELKVEVELLPDIALPDFGAIAVTRLRADVAPETVDKALNEIANRNRSLIDIPPEDVGERGAQKGQVVQLDYAGRVDGTEFPGGRGTDVSVEVSGPGFIPGFAEQIEGLRPGESRTIEVNFPAEYGVKEVAGKTATFEVTAKAVKQPQVPAVGQELAEKLGFEQLGELRDFVSSQVRREYDELSRMRLKRELLDALNGMVSFACPDGMVDAEFAQIWTRVEADRQAGRLDEEDKDKDEATLRADYRTIATRRVRLGLLLAKIGRVHGIQVGADEITRAVRAEARRFPGQEAQVTEFFRNNPRAAEQLAGPIFENKVIDYLLELATVSDRTVTPEELALEPDADADARRPVRD